LFTFFRRGQFRKKMSQIKYRLLAAICLSDLVNSVAYALFMPAMIFPQGNQDVWGAFGTELTCKVHGLFMHLGNIGAAYNGGLAVYFLLSLRYRQSDAQISSRYEIYMHLWGLAWPLITGLAALAMDLYHFGGVGCWIAPYPYGCHEPPEKRPPEYTELFGIETCTKAQRAYLYAWVFTGIPLFVTNCIIMLSMFLTYLSVREIYQKAQRPILRVVEAGFVSQDDGAAARSRYEGKIQQAGIQAILYSTLYFVTHMFAFWVTLTEMFSGRLHFWLVWLHVFFWPQQGFWNVFIFLRPTILQIQRRDPTISYAKAAYIAAFIEAEPGRLSFSTSAAAPPLGFGMGPGLGAFSTRSTYFRQMGSRMGSRMMSSVTFQNAALQVQKDLEEELEIEGEQEEGDIVGENGGNLVDLVDNNTREENNCIGAFDACGANDQDDNDDSMESSPPRGALTSADTFSGDSDSKAEEKEEAE